MKILTKFLINKKNSVFKKYVSSKKNNKNNLTTIKNKNKVSSLLASRSEATSTISNAPSKSYLRRKNKIFSLFYNLLDIKDPLEKKINQLPRPTIAKELRIKKPYLKKFNIKSHDAAKERAKDLIKKQIIGFPRKRATLAKSKSATIREQESHECAIQRQLSKEKLHMFGPGTTYKFCRGSASLHIPLEYERLKNQKKTLMVPSVPRWIRWRRWIQWRRLLTSEAVITRKAWIRFLSSEGRIRGHINMGLYTKGIYIPKEYKRKRPCKNNKVSLTKKQSLKSHRVSEAGFRKNRATRALRDILPYGAKTSPLRVNKKDFNLKFYGDFLTELNNAQLKLNKNLILLYWRIGNQLNISQKEEGWGSKVIKRLSQDLQKEFPLLKGLGPQNLKFMRKLAETYKLKSISKKNVDKIPWGHIVMIIYNVKDKKQRDWYINKTLENSWSRRELNYHIKNNLYARYGKGRPRFARKKQKGPKGR